MVLYRLWVAGVLRVRELLLVSHSPIRDAIGRPLGATLSPAVGVVHGVRMPHFMGSAARVCCADAHVKSDGRRVACQRSRRQTKVLLPNEFTSRGRANMDVAARLMVSGVLCVAGASKILAFRGFMDVLSKSIGLGRRQSFGAGVVIVAAELVVGVLLLAGIAVDWAAAAAATLFVAFSGFISVKLLGSREPGGCNCFGRYTKLAWRGVTRNLALVALAVSGSGRFVALGCTLAALLLLVSFVRPSASRQMTAA